MNEMRLGKAFDIGYMTTNYEEYEARVWAENEEQAAIVAGALLAATKTELMYLVEADWDDEPDIGKLQAELRAERAKNRRLEKAIEQATMAMEAANRFAARYGERYEKPGPNWRGEAGTD